MNRPILSDFLKQYPKCPVCLEHEPKMRRFFAMRNGQFTNVDYRCPEGHYEISISAALEEADSVYVHFINLISVEYDISICIPDDWIRIRYGVEIETERILKCDDYNKWMLTHEQLIDKLNKLWSLI